MLTASAATSIVEAGARDVDLAVAVAVFVLVACCTVPGAVGFHLAGGQCVVTFFEGVRQFMVTNSTVIAVIVLLLLGASVRTGCPVSAADHAAWVVLSVVGRVQCIGVEGEQA